MSCKLRHFQDMMSEFKDIVENYMNVRKTRDSFNQANLLFFNKVKNKEDMYNLIYNNCFRSVMYYNDLITTNSLGIEKYKLIPNHQGIDFKIKIDNDFYITIFSIKFYYNFINRIEYCCMIDINDFYFSNILTLQTKKLLFELFDFFILENNNTNKLLLNIKEDNNDKFNKFLKLIIDDKGCEDNIDLIDKKYIDGFSPIKGKDSAAKNQKLFIKRDIKRRLQVNEFKTLKDKLKFLGYDS